MANSGTQEAVEPFAVVVLARDIGREVGGEVIHPSTGITLVCCPLDL